MTVLPYGPDDDEAAAQYLNTAIRRRRDPAVWTVLAAPERIEQTARVLGEFLDQVGLDTAARQARNRGERAALRARLITRAEHAELLREFQRWHTSAMTFRKAVRAELAILKPYLRRARRDQLVTDLRTALLTLARAVEEHQMAHRGEESLADTALWGRLSALRWPVDGCRYITLADAIHRIPDTVDSGTAVADR